MENKDINLDKNENKEIIDNKDLNKPIINNKDERILQESNSDEKKIITELEKLDYKDKNSKQNNDISKSLSVINNNYEEDKENIFIKSFSNVIYPRPISKKIIVEINQLSQRVSKDENENESNNRIIMKELRLKYFPNHKVNKIIKNNHPIFNDNFIRDKRTIDASNLKLKNINLNNKFEMNKKIIKPKILLDNINNEVKTAIKINDKNYFNSQIQNNNKLEYDNNKKQFFINLLKEDDNYINTIRPMTKKELLNISNEKAKIVTLFEKNKELVNNLRNVYEKYKILKNEYIELYKNNLENPIFSDENEEYKKYLINENNKSKTTIENYNKIFPPMTYFINDINTAFNLKNIDFIDLKNNLNSLDSNKENNKKNPINNFINLLNENKKYILKNIKEENNTTRNRSSLLNKLRSYSHLEDKTKTLKEKILRRSKDKKFKMRDYYDNMK